MPASAQIAVTRATHADVMAVDGVPEDYLGERYATLRNAIVRMVAPTNPSALPPAEQGVTAVVFLLHGIRAGIGTWVSKLGGSYLLARHPTVPFHLVGQSNGTYLFGHSLRKVRALRFARVYLGGSVLPRDFDWLTIAGNGQVDNLVNVCATKDKPVGWLCSLLRGLGRDDVGTGGFDNFDVVPPASAKQFHSLVGGHGAALADGRLDEVAAYIQNGVQPSWDQHQAASCTSPDRCSASSRGWRLSSLG